MIILTAGKHISPSNTSSVLTHGVEKCVDTDNATRYQTEERAVEIITYDLTAWHDCLLELSLSRSVQWPSSPSSQLAWRLHSNAPLIVFLSFHSNKKWLFLQKFEYRMAVILFLSSELCHGGGTVGTASVLTGVLISPQLDQGGIKFGSMSGTRAISTTSRRELSLSIFFFCKTRRWGKLTPFWQKYSLVPFLVGLRSLCAFVARCFLTTSPHGLTPHNIRIFTSTAVRN